MRVRRGKVVNPSAQGLRRFAHLFRPPQLRILIMSVLDAIAPKDRKTVTFVCKRRFGYSGNIRLVCEALAASGQYRVQLWCEGELPDETRRALAERNVHRLAGFSPRALLQLASSGTLVVDHSIRDAYIVRRSVRRALVNVWHGVPIKNIELGIRGLDPARKRLMARTASLYDAMIASSELDRDAIVHAFGVSPDAVHITGLPRYDLLTGAVPLASDLQLAERRLQERLRGRRLVLYAPTFREHGASPLAQLGAQDWKLLAQAVRSSGAVLGVRGHPYDRTPCPSGIDGVISVPASEFSETNLLLRRAEALITDFSSIWVDYVLLDRPILGFARDREAYVSRERGFIYEFDDVFPGPFCSEVPDLAERLRTVLAPGFAVHHAKQRELFHSPATSTHTDQCVRVIRQVAERKLAASS